MSSRQRSMQQQRGNGPIQASATCDAAAGTPRTDGRVQRHHVSVRATPRARPPQQRRAAQPAATPPASAAHRDRLCQLPALGVALVVALHLGVLALQLSHLGAQRGGGLRARAARARDSRQRQQQLARRAGAAALRERPHACARCSRVRRRRSRSRSPRGCPFPLPWPCARTTSVSLASRRRPTSAVWSACSDASPIAFSVATSSSWQFMRANSTTLSCGRNCGAGEAGG